MKNINNKEFYPEETQDGAKEKLNDGQKAKGDKKLKKRVLAATLSGLLTFGSPSLIKAGEAVTDHLKSDGAKGKVSDVLKQPKDEIINLEAREGIFEHKSAKKTIDKLNWLVEKIGPWAAEQLGLSWVEIYNLENRPEAKGQLIKKLNQKPEIKEGEIKEPAIMDSMKQIGLEPEIIKEVLKTFPPSWLRDVSLITYLEKSNETVVNQETGEKEELVAHHQSKGGAALSEIYFFRGAKTKRADMLLFILIWEYAHANNWKHDSDLTLAQRISLLYEFVNRVESADRYKNPFIESVKHGRKEDEIAKKSIEYWAMICMWVLAKPLDKSIPLTDKNMVSSFLKITDPEFDIVKAAELREDIIRRYREYLIKKGVIKEEEWILKDEKEKEEIKSDDLRDYSPYSNT